MRIKVNSNSKFSEGARDFGKRHGRKNAPDAREQEPAASEQGLNANEQEKCSCKQGPDTNDQKPGAREYKPAMVFVLALVLSFICFQLFLGQSLNDMLIQEAVLAAIAVCGVALACPAAFLHRVKPAALHGLGRWIGYVLVVGVVAGMMTFFLTDASLTYARVLDVSAIMLHLGVLALLCLLTGVYEEGVFRVLALRAFGVRLAPLRAVIASSVLFGLFHASFGDAWAIGNAVAWAQSLIKVLQAGLFGFLMAALYLRTRNIGIAAGVHALFDFVYLAPLVAVTGMQPAYVTGNIVDMVILIVATLLLIPAAIKAASRFKNKNA